MKSKDLLIAHKNFVSVWFLSVEFILGMTTSWNPSEKQRKALLICKLSMMLNQNSFDDCCLFRLRCCKSVSLQLCTRLMQYHTKIDLQIPISNKA
jgi:hypothetical protein